MRSRLSARTAAGDHALQGRAPGAPCRDRERAPPGDHTAAGAARGCGAGGAGHCRRRGPRLQLAQHCVERRPPVRVVRPAGGHERRVARRRALRHRRPEAGEHLEEHLRGRVGPDLRERLRGRVGSRIEEHLRGAARARRATPARSGGGLCGRLAGRSAPARRAGGLHAQRRPARCGWRRGCTCPAWQAGRASARPLRVPQAVARPARPPAWRRHYSLG